MEVKDTNFWRGKKANIIILFNNEKLVYTARILYMGYFHVCFIDKFKKIYSYNLMNVVEIEKVKENEKDEFKKIEEERENGIF